MTGHPDEAFLDGLAWAFASCERCLRFKPTVAVGHIEACSGPGYEDRRCRDCVAAHLAEERVLAERQGTPYEPALPLW